ncbi:hypothetical protein FRC14_001329 [Serendipita sp. 396]|nr:hypothetical protein FRC14_001329 [Serendipita sp. 396]KAG8774302.1 hypothetical protein FRC15_001373 [Serendipita sp. 397]KAG8787658.1 hypothetical protein FRC16_001515 [Serendipita sp. 398]KAG8815454.1 hypothetical protein FRC19_001022 [Serendipita sp. 401]KAG8850971.1 hypothetical protein FRC20_001890 [Serendipita sp. 405]KAG9047318.1 hypothetical protein FS842_000671 [Serendipita sp. 407]
MSDSDVELDLLTLDEDVQTFGEHELKTTPLATREAIEAQEDELEQRGLLGKVLSVHGDGLSPSVQDPRLYMNLDAPSSGLVCGVQGSGKSHTVSCIMESSLIVDRRIGNLPAPLSTIVFHYDEENGGRPCEAAFLSELKGGLGKAFKKVVVLVSPSILQNRKRVYSGLKYVSVKALKIAEKDLNASRMLSMMDVDNLEAAPLYLHRALSILREMGSDGFNYGEFRKRLSEQEFNGSQSAMLRLRLDLLDSFLRGDGSDLTSFFKPGRLIIIDLSDPFVDGTTAAMLFDICLGLFIEWKTNSGKLIVLDEAHKYLTSVDANRFTKSICSIIRQQRHLAARVIVSTQEPTVVPSSVLDLLSWIICHRFSSPSWVKHLAHHVCAGQEINDSEANPEWGKRVMTLKTGQALLFSPASLFVSNKGLLVTLSMGYAVIKSRPRLTRDGGESILATAPSLDHPVTNVLLTPQSSDASLPAPIASRRALRDTTNTSLSLVHMEPKTTTTNNSLRLRLGRGFLPSGEVAAPSTPLSSRFIRTKFTNNGSPSPPASLSTASIRAPSTAKSRAVPNSTSTKPLPPVAIPRLPTAASVLQYKDLIRVMKELDPSCGAILFSVLGGPLRKINPNAYDGKLKKYLEAAQDDSVVQIKNSDRVVLHPSYLKHYSN